MIYGFFENYELVALDGSVVKTCNNLQELKKFAKEHFILGDIYGTKASGTKYFVERV